ncbi:MAG: hypothetical protein WA144_12475 [Candidatus Methanoperedens sp.]
MQKNHITRGVSFEPEVFMALEKLRGNRQRVRSRFINDALRLKLGLSEKQEVTTC